MAVSYPDTPGVSQYFDTYRTSLHFCKYMYTVINHIECIVMILLLQLSARESTLNEMSSLSGREVHVLHCSEHSTHQVLCDYVRGMAATGMLCLYGIVLLY